MTSPELCFFLDRLGEMVSGSEEGAVFGLDSLQG